MTILSSTGGPTKLLDSVSETGAGEIFNIKQTNRTYQVIITGIATCILEASLDGIAWISPPLRTSTGSEGYSTAEAWPFIRGNVTAFTSGTVTLMLAK